MIHITRILIIYVGLDRACMKGDTDSLHKSLDTDIDLRDGKSHCTVMTYMIRLKIFCNT